MAKKKKNKKTLAKKIAKFFVNGQPMSQVVHYTIIFSIAGIFAVNIVRAFDTLEKLTRIH